ncbi:hypothetical protein [Kistimonas scapharcae]|uniref:hypothetical protein n=1 Tax=Kistimonas scapharcae TaxID=1036133 RepID=UPI0031EE4E36
MASIATKTSQSTVSNLESGSSASRNLPRFGQRVTSEVESGFSLKQCLREIGLWFRELPGKIKNFFITCCRCTCCCPEDSLLIGQSNAVVLEPETQTSSPKQDSIKHAFPEQSAHTSGWSNTISATG